MHPYMQAQGERRKPLEGDAGTSSGAVKTSVNGYPAGTAALASTSASVHVRNRVAFSGVSLYKMVSWHCIRPS